MKPFEEWLAELAMPELPEGVVEVRPGYYEAQCNSCEEWTDIICDISEFTQEGHYCGRSPRCCP